MVNIKNDQDIVLMKKAGVIVRDTLNLIETLIKSGITTKYLDLEAEKYILQCGALPSFKGYGGFPSTLCISINDEVIHGIPSDKIIKDGDIISVDCGANIYGFHADAARTFTVGEVSSDIINLINVTKQSFFESLKYAVVGNRVGNISNAIQNYVESNGYHVVKDFTGHGIGRELHELPEVPNFGKKDSGVFLKVGMALAIEPMVNVGTDKVEVLSDDWTVVTKDGSLSAHYENTVIITENGVEIITL